MKVLELATNLEKSEKEIQEILKVLGLSWDKSGNIATRSQVFGRDIDIEKVFESVVGAQKNSPTLTLTEAASVLVETFRSRQAQESGGSQFNLDSYFAKTFGVHPSSLSPGSALYLVYKSLASHQGTGAHVVAAIYGYVQAEASAILRGEKKMPDSDLELLEQTIALGTEQSSAFLQTCFQRGLENSHLLAMTAAEEARTLPAANPNSQNSINGLLPN